MTINLSLFRKSIAILFISFFALNVIAQQKSNYSLLWKITGKNLSKPSYLFGTMHVKDKRVFNFSDSVMLSLQSCSRFAMEVHPDTLMIKMFAALQNGDSLRNIDKLLSKEDYEKLAKKFKDKNGYALGKTDPMVLESLMKRDDKKAGDKVSFIDAYLYGIARTFNKNILGLEDASSQFDLYYGSKDAVKERLLDLLDDDTETAKDESKEEMIKIYSTGNLDEIYKYVQNLGMVDSIIIARNKVMAASMIKYMADGSLFTAVGAAHLSGEDGVIALLRKEGYTVSRVQATFTGVANTYHIDYLKMNWPLYKDESMGYSVNFPGTPIKYAINGVNTFIYPDLANDVYYGVYAIPRGTPGKPANRSEIITKFLTTISSNPKNHVISRKDFVFNKMPCTEVLMTTVSGFMRMRLLLANNQLYSFYAGSKVNHLNEPSTNRFLNSFVNFPVVQKVPASWITYSNPAGAFTVKFPDQPQYILKEIPSQTKTEKMSFKLNMYVSTDTVNSISYLVRYNDYPEGMFVDDKGPILNSLVNDFKNTGKIISGPVKIWKDGYEGREIKAVLKGGFNATIKLFIRGSRIYILLKEIIQPDLKDDNVDAFFDSFQFTPYIEPAYYNFKDDSNRYEVQMVSKPKVLIDSASTTNYTNYVKNIVTYYSTNPNSGGVYGFEHSTIRPYFRISNTDSLYTRMIKSLIGYQDTLLKVDTITIDGVKGREFLTQKKATNDKSRVRMLISGDGVFYLVSHLDNSELFDKTSNTFYNSLKITNPNPSNTYLAASKAAQIFKALDASDTSVYNNALGALAYYDFKADEYPAVYEALQKSYPDDSLKTGVRATLIKKFRGASNDTTANFLISLYPKLKGKDILKGSVLSIITTVDKKNGYDNYLKLLTTDPPVNVKEGYQIFNPLNDSLEFAAAHFEQILPLIKYENLRTYILRVAQQMANKKDDPFASKLKANYPSLMAHAQADIDNYILLRDSTDNMYNGEMYNYMQLIGQIKNGELNDKLTNSYLARDPNGFYATDALIARIKNRLPNNQQLVNKYLDSVGTRYDVMEAFSKQNQLGLVPLKYKTQSEYAKLCLYQSLSQEDDGTPTKITLLGSIIKNGAVYYAFKFLLPERDDKNELIGLTGPYKPGSTKLNFERYNAYTDYEVVKVNWRLQATKMVGPLIEAYK
ncbi:TraB/GumN family protein [Mucilaginibacter sp.]|uniref:TraB/GumN family protein n=1 Tax=Mucilaginibacter sp. TaxID=1882438 RepID=UPI0026196870|nr:TraB/GumN family protein [Mucilaginibacter sp.]MDB4919936.1 GumN family protein [Mucilaginibacter sp.]